MSTSAADAAIRAFTRERRYTPATVEQWLGLTAADGAALLDLALELRLGENQLRDLWQWAEEIGTRDGLKLAEVLSLETVTTARRQPGGRNDRLNAIKNSLRRLRFPTLSATEERLRAVIRLLQLPSNVRVCLPAFLEGDEIRIEITADTPAALRSAAQRLHEVADSGMCTELFGLLGGMP